MIINNSHFNCFKFYSNLPYFILITVNNCLKLNQLNCIYLVILLCTYVSDLVLSLFSLPHYDCLYFVRFHMDCESCSSSFTCPQGVLTFSSGNVCKCTSHDKSCTVNNFWSEFDLES